MPGTLTRSFNNFGLAFGGLRCGLNTTGTGSVARKWRLAMVGCGKGIIRARDSLNLRMGLFLMGTD